MIRIKCKSQNLLKLNNFTFELNSKLKLIIIGLSLFSSLISYSQNGFIFRDHFGADQSASYGLIEHEDYIYATGTHQDNSLGYKGIYVAKIDERGVVLNHEVYYDEVQLILAQNLVHDVHILGNKLYVVASSFTFNDKIIQYDLNSDKIDSIFSFDLFENSPPRLKSFTVFNNEIVTLLNSTMPVDDKMIIQFGLGESSNRIIVDRAGIKESGFKIYQNNNEELIIMNALFSDNLSSGNINLLKIDAEGNILFTYNVDKRSSISFDVLEEEDGSYVFPYIEFDFNFRSKPRIIKIDENGEELWDVSIGGDLWDSNISDHWNRVIESNEKDGYVFAGRNTEEIGVDSFLTSGVIGKLSKEGDNIWYKKFNVVDENIRFHSINDLEKSNNGYVASGELFYNVIIDDIPFVQSYFVKIDNEGNINADTTSIVDKFDTGISSHIKIYPNPSSEFFYVEQNEISNIKYQVVSLDGKLVKEFKADQSNQVLIVPIGDLPKGSYFLKASSRKGESNTWPIVIN